MVNEPWRNRMAARLGEPAWQGVYSVIALTGLILVILGYGVARQEPTFIYWPPASMRHATFLLMVPVFPLLIATYAPGRISAATRHPMLVAVILWSAGHLLSNGTMADVLLFGSFLLWAVADRISMTYRIQRPIPALPHTRANDVIAVVGGLGIYAAFVYALHGSLIGMALVQ